jgi:hypothetical protein
MRRRHRTEGDGANAIDPRSGFKVKLADLVKDGYGDLIYRPFADKKHPQDFPPRIHEDSTLPYSRPEPADSYMALGIMWENGYSPIMEQAGRTLLSEGQVVSL